MNQILLDKNHAFVLKVIGLASFFIMPCVAVADDDISHQSPVNSLTNAMQLAQQKNLANSIAWRRFLYFDDKINAKDDKSRVINRFNPIDNQRKFFVSQNGGYDPKAELQATLTALLDPDVAKKLTGDNAVACRFPARVNWLKQQLNLTDLSNVTCPTYQAWQAKIDPQSASIIFANEYLDSPPSAFAHNFLRFDNSHDPYYLNYTPRVTEGESQAKFAYKSAIVGNAGEFTINNYAQGIQDYKVNQGRDVWTYQLNLTPSQLQQLSDQVFEIKDQILPYYLLDKNCASEVLVLLNTLFPEKNYLTGMHATIAPVQLVRRLQQQNLIKKVTFEPSATTLKQAQLNAKRVTAIPTTPLTPSRTDPQLANPLRQWSVGYAYQNTANSPDENGLKLGYRMVYHDALDKPTGYPLGSQLTGLSADILLNPDAKHGQNDVQLEQATLIKMRSLNPINTAKGQKNPTSWGVNVGLEQAFDKARFNQDNDTDSHLVGNVNLEYGRSIAYGKPQALGEMPPNICYGLGNVATQFGKGLDKGFRVGVGANVGCIQQLGQNLRGLAQLSLPYWVSGDSDNERYWQPKLSVGMQFDVNKANAIRLLASRDFLGRDSKDRADKVSVSFVKYFE